MGRFLNCLGLAILCLLPSAIWGGEDRKPLAEVAEIFAKKMPKGGIVTAEGSNGKVGYTATGRLGSAAPDHMIFEIGSITKVFTGLLLAQAIVEKKVTLETTVGSILGKETTFADPRIAAITLRQLATHSSGLPRLPLNFTFAMERNKDDPYSIYDREMMMASLTSMKLTGEPPYEFDYSNLGVGLLGDLLSRVYDKSWEELVREKITGPLGMPDTVMTLDEKQKERFVTAYQGAKQVKAWSFAVLCGCGALHSTASDLVIFGEAILHPEQTPLKDAITLMEQPQDREGDVGLNLMISKSDGQKVYEHNGATAGFRSYLQVEPDTGVVRVLLANNGNAPLEKILADARGEKPRVRESGKLLTHDQLAEYQGVYKVNEHLRFTTVLRGDQLWDKLSGQNFLRLFPHEDADRFFYKAVAAEIQFNREGDHITGLTLFQNGRALKAQKLPDAVPNFVFPTAKQLAAYAGTYVLNPKTSFTLRAQGTLLTAQLTGQEAVPVFETRNDYFEYDVVEAALEFQRDRRGQIIAVVLHQNGFDQRAVKK